MHEAAHTVDLALARELIAASFPEHGDAVLRPVATIGTVNTIVRVGEDLVARFPLLPVARAEAEAEAESMTALAVSSPFPAPLPRGVADGSAAFPSAWSLQTWLPGETAGSTAQAASVSLAEDLVTLIRGLRATEVEDRVFDGRGRGGTLTDHDEWVAECLHRSGHLLDTDRATRLWKALRSLPSDGPDVMSHRDLTPFNLLVREADGVTRLVGVLDGGGFGPADRALDLVSAWHLFDAPARAVLRDGVGVSDTEWLRGAAWAFQQAIGLGWYYEQSNPPMSTLGLTTLRRLLDDQELATLDR